MKKEKEHIEQKFEQIKKEFEEFKSLHAVTVDNLQQALKIKADSRIVSKPLGAPKGHVGYSRHVPERIDHIKVMVLISVRIVRLTWVKLRKCVHDM